MSQEEINRLNELYNKFVNDLKNHEPNLYYDEDDLIDIFDYAGDVHNEYIRLEALLLGHKLFPNSFDLLKRRAIYLADIDDNSFGEFIKANNSIAETDIMWEILRIRAFGNTEDIAEQLTQLLTDFTLEDDEEIIQFVNIVHQFGQEQWMIDNLDFIKSRCRYPDTLTYEFARTAETPQQMETGVKLLEQLTEIDPFNIDYWGLLADNQAALEKYDESLASLEYAKAINPDNADIYNLEGYIRLQLNQPHKAIDALEKYLSFDKIDNAAIKNLVQAYKLASQTDKMKTTVKNLFELDPSDSSIFMDMMVMFPDEVEATLEKFHNAPSEHDEQSTMMRISELSTINTSLALRYISWYSSRYPITQTTHLAVLELLYLSGKHSESLTYLDKNFNEFNPTYTEYPYIGLIASILIRNHRFEDAEMFIDLWLKNLSESEAPNYVVQLLKNGVIETLRRMKDALADKRDLSTSEIEAITL